MIRFSESGCAIIDVPSYMPFNQMVRYIEMFEDERKQAKNVEFVIDTGSIIEASDDSFHHNGGKARSFEIGDYKWRHLKRVAERAYITIKQGSWYFTFAKQWGIGYWYSGDMLRLGWYHGGKPQEIDHTSRMYARRDYGS